MGVTLTEGILIIGFLLVIWNLWIIVDRLKEISRVLFTVKEIQSEVHLPEIRARERIEDD